LERERQKLERTLGILSQQHAIDMDNLQRKSKREWQNACAKLQEQLGQQQTKFVMLELQRARGEKLAQAKDLTLRRELSDLNVVVAVRSPHALSTDLFYFMICFFIVLLCLIGTARCQPAGLPNWNKTESTQIIK
jgi:hypothetical protein